MHTLPPYAEVIYATVDDLARLYGAPVRTRVLADLLGISPRTARWYAAMLESVGLLKRRTPKTGYLPADPRAIMFA